MVTTAHFRNDTFCFLSDNSFADYEPNKVTGLPSGNADFYWVMFKRGGCSDWMSENHTYENPLKVCLELK